jgi:hypothetical protein
MIRKEWEFAGVQALITVAVQVLISLPILFGSSGDAPPIIPPPTPSSCSDQQELWGPAYGYDGYNGSATVPVLLMQPSTSGFICVVYESESNGGVVPNATGIDGYLQGFRIFKSRCSTEGGGIGCSYRPANSFETSGFRLNSTAPFVSNSSTIYVGVVYSVTALSNATGFYVFSAPRLGCGGLPMAVGYSASQPTAMDFVGFFTVYTCPHAPFSPVEAGVIGIRVTSLDFAPQP